MNEELDQLYAEQRQTFDRDARQAIVHEFQRIHYEEIPEIALVYPELLHAYRTDTFEGYVELAHERRRADLRLAGGLLHEPHSRWSPGAPATSLTREACRRGSSSGSARSS